MVNGEVIINEEFCKACGYCVKFCARGCITQGGNRLSSKGYLLPTYSSPEKCNACGVCAWMCPDYAIEVYKNVED